MVGAWPASSVQFNGKDLSFALPIDETDSIYQEDFWTYDPSTLTLLINIASLTSTTSLSSAKLTFSQSLQDPILFEGYTRKLDRLQQCKDLLDNEWSVYLCFVQFILLYYYFF